MHTCACVREEGACVTLCMCALDDLQQTGSRWAPDSLQILVSRWRGASMSSMSTRTRKGHDKNVDEEFDSSDGIDVMVSVISCLCIQISYIMFAG